MLQFAFLQQILLFPKHSFVPVVDKYAIFAPPKRWKNARSHLRSIEKDKTTQTIKIN